MEKEYMIMLGFTAELAERIAKSKEEYLALRAENKIEEHIPSEETLKVLGIKHA